MGRGTGEGGPTEPTDMCKSEETSTAVHDSINQILFNLADR